MIDKVYAQKLLHAQDKGVEIITRDVGITLEHIHINQRIPVLL